MVAERGSIASASLYNVVYMSTQLLLDRFWGFVARAGHCCVWTFASVGHWSEGGIAFSLVALDPFAGFVRRNPLNATFPPIFLSLSPRPQLERLCIHNAGVRIHLIPARTR